MNNNEWTTKADIEDVLFKWAYKQGYKPEVIELVLYDKSNEYITYKEFIDYIFYNCQTIYSLKEFFKPYKKISLIDFVTKIKKEILDFKKNENFNKNCKSFCSYCQIYCEICSYEKTNCLCNKKH